MSYVRQGQDGSDVYVIGSDAYECCGCASFQTAENMLIHLHRHRANGDCVPEYVFTRLEQDMMKDKKLRGMSLPTPWWTDPKSIAAVEGMGD